MKQLGTSREAMRRKNLPVDFPLCSPPLSLSTENSIFEQDTYTRHLEVPVHETQTESLKNIYIYIVVMSLLAFLHSTQASYDSSTIQSQYVSHIMPEGLRRERSSHQMI